MAEVPEPKLPPLPSTVRGLLGRPVWNELRAPAELAALRDSDVIAGAGLAPGDGRPVVLVPGYLATGRSLGEMRDWLARHGYVVAIAPVRGNWRSSSWAASQVEATVRAAAERAGRPVVLIGHSRGGQQCRVVTRRLPDLVEVLITVAAPVRHHLPRSAVLRGSVEALRLIGRTPLGPDANIEEDKIYESDLFAPFPEGVAWTALYSKSDGVVEWQSCLDPAAEMIEVGGTHIGMTSSVTAFEAVAAALA